jgi:hypothetical protein
VGDRGADRVDLEGVNACGVCAGRRSRVTPSIGFLGRISWRTARPKASRSTILACFARL